MPKGRNVAPTSNETRTFKKSGGATPKVVDPKLADLFGSSASIPRAPPSISNQVVKKPGKVNGYSENAGHPKEDSVQGSDGTDDEPATSGSQEGVTLSQISSTSEPAKSRKRKRMGYEDDIEGNYLKKLALEERDEVAINQKHRAHLKSTADSGSQPEDDEDASQSRDASTGDGEDEEEAFDVPMHESLMPSGTELGLDKAARTVFLGNVSTLAIKSKQSKKLLLDHLCSIFASMKQSQEQSLESIRFRSTAYSDGSIPKKAAFAKRELMDATTQSTNAYAVYSTTSAAREAVKSLNGTVILERHLRVDSVAHPSPIDHRRCVFVGNLGFVDDESNIRASEQVDGQQRQKAKTAADAEEGLWVHFAKAGLVESVRVVRDRNTRVGKGIAYVQFKDPNSVEKALSFNEKKFPPMLPRKLRVTRARKLKRVAAGARSKVAMTNSRTVLQPKQSAQLSTLSGRANRLLGRAGGHHVRKQRFKLPEDIVFEGHRAVPGSKGTKDSKKKKKDKRTNRSAAYRSRKR